MNLPAPSKAKRGRPAEPTAPVVAPEFQPLPPGSRFTVSHKSRIFPGQTVVVKRYLGALGSYAVHIEHHKARDGYVLRHHVETVTYVADSTEPTEHKAMLFVPAPPAAECEPEMVKFTPLPATAPEAPRNAPAGALTRIPALTPDSHPDPLTKAEHIRDWMQTYDRSRDQAALSMGVSIGTIDNFLYLLKAPDALKARLRSGQVSMYKAIAEMRGAPKTPPANKPVPVPAAPADTPTTPTPPPPAPVAPTVGGINLAALKPERYRRQSGGHDKSTAPVLCFTARTIGINDVAMEHLGKPQRVHLFFDAGQRVVVIAAAAADDRSALSLQLNGKKLSSRKASMGGFCKQFDLTPPASPVRVEAVLHNGQLLAVFPVPEKAGEP